MIPGVCRSRWPDARASPTRTSSHARNGTKPAGRSAATIVLVRRRGGATVLRRRITKALWALIVVLSASLACAETPSAQATSIMSLGVFKTASPVGAAVAPGMTGTACGFVSGGSVGPFTITTAGLPAPVGACPTTPFSVTTKEILSNLGVSAVSGFTSTGGTVPKVVPQTVSADRNRTAVGGTPVLADGMGKWVTAAGTGVVTYTVSASGGLAGGVIYAGTGLAEDPYNLAPGTYPYQPVIQSLSLTNTEPTGLAEFDVLADSSLGPLWQANVDLLGTGTALVGFQSMPELSALGISVNDISVAMALGADLNTSVPNTVTLLAPFSPFPVSSAITLDSTTTFSDAAIAYAGPVAPIPEPSTLLSLSSALALMVIRRRFWFGRHQLR